MFWYWFGPLFLPDTTLILHSFGVALLSCSPYYRVRVGLTLSSIKIMPCTASSDRVSLGGRLAVDGATLLSIEYPYGLDNRQANSIMYARNICPTLDQITLVF